VTREVPPAAPRPASAILGPAPPEPEPEDYDAFAHEPPFRPRRNWTKIWTIAAVVAAILMLGATAAISIWGLPDLGGRLAFARKGAGSPLRIVDQKHARTAMESGNELLTITGLVTNPSEATQRVPSIRADFRDKDGRTIYTSIIAPPVPELQPGESKRFSRAEVGVPPAAKDINLTFGPTI
jgi:hypothetical protein